ncbi:MAG: type II secretion system GspH family protein [Symbiobacteriaceae bacterium]
MSIQHRRNGRRRRQGGFTLIELGVALAIVALLVAIAVPTYLNMVNRARDAEAQQAWNMVKAELWGYYVENGKFPSVDSDWWAANIDRPAERPNGWTYEAVYRGDEEAQMNARGYGRVLCWSIDKNGIVRSGRAEGSTCTPASQQQ